MVRNDPCTQASIPCSIILRAHADHITSTGEQSGITQSPRERVSAGESTRKSFIETTMAGEFKRKRSRENSRERERVQKTALERALDRTLEIAKEKT